MSMFTWTTSAPGELGLMIPAEDIVITIGNSKAAIDEQPNRRRWIPLGLALVVVNELDLPPNGGGSAHPADSDSTLMVVLAADFHEFRRTS